MVSPAVRTVLLGGPSPEARAIFAKMTTPPTGQRRSQIDACIKALKSAGVWTQLDALYMLAANDEQASRINWKNPANSLTAVNAPTFSANLGWTFASTKSLSTGYDFSAGVAGAKYASANAHIFTFATTDSATDSRSDLGSETVASAFINSRTAAGLIFGRLNFGTGGDAFGAVPTSVGMTLINRTNDTNAQYCRDGSVVYDRAIASGAVPGNLVIGNAPSSGTQPSPRRLAAAGFGGGLNTSQLPAYYNAVYGYLHAVGAI